MRLLRFGIPAALASLLLLTASDAPAGCSTGGVWAMPKPGGPLAVNGLVVVEGSGYLTDAVAALDGQGLVLASDTEEVPLRVEAIHKGTWRVAEAVLAPVRPLEPGKRHVLRAAGALQGSPLDAAIQSSGQLAWTTRPSAPPDELHWTARPSHGDARFGHGCPPEASVPVRVSVDHPENLLGVLAEVRALKAGAPSQRYVLPIYDGVIYLGFVGCEMPVGLSAGFAHLVKLTALDLAGREVPAPGERFAVVGPSDRR